jgi:D-alanyl-D-alanine carboxypeptidase
LGEFELPEALFGNLKAKGDGVTLFARMAALLSGALLCASAAVAGPAMLVDAKTGLVLYSENADYPWQPASLTKLMTAYLVFGAIRDGKLSPEDTLTCSAQAATQEPSKLGLPAGAQIPVDLALKALIVKSANDVAMMFAEKLGGTEAGFVAQMNETAKRLGMTNTHFVNPNGLPEKLPEGQTPGPGQYNVTTARDMAILARALFREFPDYDGLYALPFFKIGKRLLRSHNSLLRAYDGADGMKTGFICASGYNLVGSATRGDHHLIAVVLGEASGRARTVRAASLFEHGFDIYPWKEIFAPTLATLPVDTPDGAQAPDLRPIVCKPRPRRVRHKKHPVQVHAKKAAVTAIAAKAKGAAPAPAKPKH